jgi:hypothetical protein
MVAETSSAVTEVIPASARRSVISDVTADPWLMFERSSYRLLALAGAVIM